MLDIYIYIYIWIYIYIFVFLFLVYLLGVWQKEEGRVDAMLEEVRAIAEFQSAGGHRVVSLLEEVLADTRKTEDQTTASEADSQSTYENFMKD